MAGFSEIAENSENIHRHCALCPRPVLKIDELLRGSLAGCGKTGSEIAFSTVTRLAQDKVVLLFPAFYGLPLVEHKTLQDGPRWVKLDDFGFAVPFPTFFGFSTGEVAEKLVLVLGIA